MPDTTDPYAAFSDVVEAPTEAVAVVPDAYASVADPVEAPAADPYAEIADPVGQSTAKNVVNAATTGALDQGFYSGAEGVARMVDSASTSAAIETVMGEEYRRLGATLGDLERTGMQISNAAGRAQVAAQLAQVKARRAEIEAENADQVGFIRSLPADSNAAGWYAGAVVNTRKGIRQALPVDEAFAKSIKGQIISGLGQAAGTLPLYAVPGAGPGVTVGQMYDQGYQDAKAAGADEETASQAGFANVPAAALDVAADRLIIGKVLKPLKGKLTVGQLLKAIGVSGASEGITEGAQQVWSNLVAKQLVGYDPERPLDDQVINSMIVGAVVGGTVTAVGQGVTATAGPGSEGGGRKPEAGGPEGGSSVQSEQDAAFNPFESGEAIPDGDAANQSTAGMMEGQTGTPGSAPAIPAPISSEVVGDDDLADITPESIRADSLPAAGEAAGTGASPADSVPVAEATQPGAAQAAAVSERSGEVDTGKSKAKGKAFRLGSRPDGVTDLLDAIEAIGGIAPPGPKAGGEYDGFREVFGRGAPRLLVRKSGQRIDQAMQELAEMGFAFDSSDTFKDAVGKAAESRRKAVEAMRSDVDQGKFAEAIFENKGKRANERGKAGPVDSDSFNVGDKFKVKGEPFVVVGIDPDTLDVIVRDGPRYGTQTLPAGTPVYPDAKSIKKTKAPARTVQGDEPFARRKPAAGADAGQLDAFAGGETGGDTLFNLQGPSIDATIANWSIDEEMSRREAVKAQGKAQGELLFAERTADPERAAADRAKLTELQAKWRANAEKVAPGLMQSFRLAFGDPSVLARMGRADPQNLTGHEEAAYLANERMLFLFDQALLRSTDLQATVNLLHEMGHAHYDTLPPARQAELLDLWRAETAGRTGPLYTGGKLKRGVAMGVEASVKEWYAERVAWTNHQWARSRVGGAGLIVRMAQQFRQLLAQLAGYVEKLRGVTIGRDFRTFLDQGAERFADVATTAPARPRPVLAKSAGLVGIPAIAQRGGSNYAIRAYHGTPHKVDKFSLSKIGTGEGAQVYGWGLYFAQNPNVARMYAANLTGPTDQSREAFQKLRDALKEEDYLGFDTAAEAISALKSSPNWREDFDLSPATAEAVKAYLGSKGNVYEVDLVPDEETFLDWDKPLSEQAEPVKALIREKRAEARAAFMENQGDAKLAEATAFWRIAEEAVDGVGDNYFANGGWFYQRMAGALGVKPADASAQLAAAGVPGVKYLDAGSRGRLDGAIKGTRNFVIFDDNLVQILAQESAQFARRSPQQVAEDSARNVRTWLSRNLTSAAGLPAKVFESKLAKDGRMASIAKQMQFALRDLDRAMHAVYGGYKAMTSAQLAELNEVLGGLRPLSTVDARLHGPLHTMRTHIDTLSARLVREGAIDAKMMTRVGGNIGFYLNRSYRKFDDKNWARNVPEAVRNRAESFVAAELAAQNPGQPVDPREVKGYVEYLLNKDTANESLYKEPAKLGAKSLDVLKARKDLPIELRELMGEYLDPRVNYLRSVAKTAQILEANRFLRDVRRAGMGSWLFPRPIVDASGSYVVPLAPKGSESMAPLNGLYTTKEIAQAFASQMEAAPGMALRAWLAVNGWAKVAKTVLSPVTQARNLFGNLGFVVANGHWRADAAADVWTALRAEFGRGDTPAARDYLARLARLGVVGESINAGELREALTDAGANLQGFEQWTDSRLMRIVKSPFKVAARLYQLNDEVFKIYSFENERRAWAKVDPTLRPEQLDTIAAARVRNTLPTYSLIPKAVQAVRRVGLTGSFLSFPSEIVRTGYHSIRYALADLASANPRQKVMGAKRLGGLIMVASLPAAVSFTTRWLAGMDKDDEDDVRRFLPEWSENAALYFTSADGRGRFGMIDASYLDPWNYLKKPLTAALRGEDWQSSLANAGREAMDPFAGEGLVTKGIFDLARNQDDRGRMVFNPQAPFLDRTQEQLAHVWSVYEPGLITQARRIVKAANGEVSAGGRTYDLENELAAVVTGARRQDIDVAQSLLFRAKRFAGEKQGAELLFKEVRDRRGTVTPKEIEEARDKMETARRALFEGFAEDVAAAQRLGVRSDAVMLSLMSAGMSPKEAARVVGGIYVPYAGQPDLRRAALEQAVTARE